jgi:hypothetical protein
MRDIIIAILKELWFYLESILAAVFAFGGFYIFYLLMVAAYGG